MCTQLFLEHERLFFEMAQRGHEVLTDEQIERAETIYHTEKDEMLETLLPSLNRAVNPHFEFAARGEISGNGSFASLESLEPVLAT